MRSNTRARAPSLIGTRDRDSAGLADSWYEVRARSADAPMPSTARPPHRLRLAPGRTRELPGAAVVGPGDDEYVCGRCFGVVVKGVDPQHCRGVLLRCDRCGAVNENRHTLSHRLEAAESGATSGAHGGRESEVAFDPAGK